jgi:small GTP-binding protein
MNNINTSNGLSSQKTLYTRDSLKGKTVEFRRSELNDSRFTEKESSIMDRVVYRFKVILLGDIAVGKTSILSRFVEDKFTAEYKCNVGVEFKVKSLFLDEITGADLQIWDTCGEERFRTITRQYYRDTYGVILIFDLTNRNSFEKLSSWLEDINEFGPKEITIILIGNKSDLDDERKVLFNEAYNFANKNNLQYIEVSAKTGNNVGLLFENLTKAMVRREKENEKKRKKKGKIDKSHVTANKTVTLDNTMKLEKQHTNNNGCCK